MSEQSIADRGCVRELQPAPHADPLWAAVSRLGSLRLSVPAASLWLQLRGCTTIESREGRPRLTVVAMTATIDAGARAECAAAGMDDFLPKPVEQGQLEALLARVVQATAR